MELYNLLVPRQNLPMEPFKKYVTGLPPILDPPPPLSLFVTVCLDPPPPPCHHPNSDKLYADIEPTFDANFRSHI